MSEGVGGWVSGIIFLFHGKSLITLVARDTETHVTHLWLVNISMYLTLTC